MTKAKQFCEALEAVSHLDPQESRKVEEKFNPRKERNKEEKRLYFRFDDNSACYFDQKKGVITLVI